MTPSTRSIVFLFLFSLLPLSAESSEYMLFSPRPLEGELLMPERGKGVLVQRITIKRGDTLSQISRVYSGKGSYYPQILLFNDITNPDRIFAGKELMVPVSKQEALSKNASQPENVSKPVKKDSLPKPAPLGLTGSKKTVPAEKNRRSVANNPLPKKSLPDNEQLAKKVEQDFYAKAVSAFSREEYDKALTLFSRFLERYPSSSMAADASLYKAECLLKLSGQ
jgi:TolA-binding protein